jgi:hypothetical protein
MGTQGTLHMLVTFPPTARTARQIAHRLRCVGFYSLPEHIWSNAADLAEHLADAQPTSLQLIWLWRAHESFLTTSVPS